MNYPTPHYDKLASVLENDKLPNGDLARIEAAIVRYRSWIEELTQIAEHSATPLEEMVNSLNDYRNYIDLELIFDSPQDFLYRQKGQLKLDNSVLEEFLPRLVHPRIIPEINLESVVLGPRSCFSSAFFTSSLGDSLHDGGLSFRTKDQDFAIAKALYIKASYDRNFSNPETAIKTTYLAYVAAECKTNLDKTMFQEACATANDVKSAVKGARYFLLCEWLDMTPLSTAPTDIDEVIILRKAKRLGSNIRSRFSSSTGRQANRTTYKNYLERNPMHHEMFQRLITHIRELINDEAPVEENVLSVGYF